MPTALNIRIQPVWHEPQIRRNLICMPTGWASTPSSLRSGTADARCNRYRTIIRSLQRMFDVVIVGHVGAVRPADRAGVPEADEILFVTTLRVDAHEGMARALREITLDESGLGIPGAVGDCP